MDLDELIRAARAAAAAGAGVARDWHARLNELNIHEKSGPRDLVSRADVETERAIRTVLQLHRPRDAVLGEEEGHCGGESEIEWLVDPIDGTTSFLYGRADWSVSVAARDADGMILAAAVAEPAHARLTWAAKGAGTWTGDRRVHLRPIAAMAEALVEVSFGRPADQHAWAGAMVDALLSRVRDLRRGGSAASSLVALATGTADAVWSPGLMPWDGSAGVLLVLEAGGVVGDLDGPSQGCWPPSGDVLAGPSCLWSPFRDLLAAVYG